MAQVVRLLLGLGRAGVQRIEIEPGRDRFVEPVDRLAFARASVEPQRAFAVGHGAAGGVIECGAPMRRRLAVRAARFGLARGLRRQAQHCGGVAGARGMVHAACDRHRLGWIGFERLQHRGMQRLRHRLGERRLHRHARQLVPKAECGGAVRHQQPRIQALLQRGHVGLEQTFDQPTFDARRHHRRQPHDRLRSSPQAGVACKHQVLHAARYRVDTAAQQLGHEERIALRQRMDAFGRSQRAPCQQVHRLRCQALHVDARDQARRQFAEQAAQRMCGGDLVVAIRHDQQHRRAVDATADEAHQVERGVVGPVHVFDHQQHRLAAALQLGQHGVEQRAALRVGAKQRAKAHLGTASDVEQRCQRLRRLQRVARAPPQQRVATPLGQRLQHAGLADTGLAGHASSVAAAARHRGEQRLELPQHTITFDQFQRRTPALPRRQCRRVAAARYLIKPLSLSRSLSFDDCGGWGCGAEAALLGPAGAPSLPLNVFFSVFSSTEAATRDHSMR